MVISLYSSNRNVGLLLKLWDINTVLGYFVAHDVVMLLFPGLALLTEEFLRRLLSLFIKEQTWATETGPAGRKPGRQST